MAYDLVLTGGRVIDPSQSIDRVTDVAFKDGKVAMVGDGLAKDAKEVTSVAGKIVTPGLIDLHTHVYWGGTSLGVDPVILGKGGCTTVVDTGSAGPGNYPGFLEHVIKPSPVRIIAYLNVSFAGIYGFSKRIMVGESGDLRLMAPLDTVEVAEAHRDTLAGIKVRVGFHASGNSGLVPLDIARQVAEQVNMPMMVHIDTPPPTLPDVLARLRKGDILTHCFRPFPNSPASSSGGVIPEVLEARERGVIFDIGHGMGSFSFATARTMLKNGFMPDCISSDVHALCIEGPAYDLLTTMSKFIELGMPLVEVIRSATQNAAAALNRPDLGTFKRGSAGDATVIDWRKGSFDYVDSTGETMTGSSRLLASHVIINGALWHTSEDQAA
jgi:dihydroorotase